MLLCIWDNGFGNTNRTPDEEHSIDATTQPPRPHPRRLCWTLRISSGVSEGVYKSVEQSDGEFLNIGVGDRQ